MGQKEGGERGGRRLRNDRTGDAAFSISLSHHLAACVITIRRLAQAMPEGASSRNQAQDG